MDQVFRKGHVSWDYVQVSISFFESLTRKLMEARNAPQKPIV